MRLFTTVICVILVAALFSGCGESRAVSGEATRVAGGLCSSHAGFRWLSESRTGLANGIYTMHLTVTCNDGTTILSTSYEVPAL